MNLHKAASDLATTAPDILAHPEVAKAMEQELVRTMVACLTAGRAAVPAAMEEPLCDGLSSSSKPIRMNRCIYPKSAHISV
jgi:hypothetical protein